MDYLKIIKDMINNATASKDYTFYKYFTSKYDRSRSIRSSFATNIYVGHDKIMSLMHQALVNVEENPINYKYVNALNGLINSHFFLDNIFIKKLIRNKVLKYNEPRRDIHDCPNKTNIIVDYTQLDCLHIETNDRFQVKIIKLVNNSINVNFNKKWVIESAHNTEQYILDQLDNTRDLLVTRATLKYGIDRILKQFFNINTYFKTEKELNEYVECLVSIKKPYIIFLNEILLVFPRLTNDKKKYFSLLFKKIINNYALEYVRKINHIRNNANTYACIHKNINIKKTKKNIKDIEINNKTPKTKKFMKKFIDICNRSIIGAQGLTDEEMFIVLRESDPDIYKFIYFVITDIQK